MKTLSCTANKSDADVKVHDYSAGWHYIAILMIL